jgi:hypothetical protein
MLIEYCEKCNQLTWHNYSYSCENCIGREKEERRALDTIRWNNLTIEEKLNELRDKIDGLLDTDSRDMVF